MPGLNRFPAQPQNYYKFLMGLPETRNGVFLMQSYKAVDRTINYLLHIPLPGPRIVRQLASLSTQQTRIFSSIQNNINSLLARQAVLQKQYLSLQAQKESLLAAGRVSRARQVGMQQGNVFNVLNSVQRLSRPNEESQRPFGNRVGPPSDGTGTPSSEHRPAFGA